MVRGNQVQYGAADFLGVSPNRRHLEKLANRFFQFRRYCRPFLQVFQEIGIRDEVTRGFCILLFLLRFMDWGYILGLLPGFGLEEEFGSQLENVIKC